MSLETDQQLKRILIIMGVGLVVLALALFPSVKKIYRFMTSRAAAQIIKDMTTVRKALVAKYEGEQIIVTADGKGSLDAFFINSRYAILPESIRDKNAEDIAKTMREVYSEPDKLSEIRIVFVKEQRRFIRKTENDVRKSYIYTKDISGKWQRLRLRKHDEVIK